MRHQYIFFCNLVASKGELIEKVLPTLSKDKIRMRVRRPRELEEQIAARNSRLCGHLVPIKKGRPVKIFTDE